MKIAIYQIDREKDRQNVAFLGYMEMCKVREHGGADRSIYDKVFEGRVDCENLSEIYMMFNLNFPEGYKGRSLSVSDVVYIDDTKEFWYCDRIGWQKIYWKE